MSTIIGEVSIPADDGFLRFLVAVLTKSCYPKSRISAAAPFLRRIPALVRFMRRFSCRLYFFWTVILFSRCCSERSL